MAEIPGCLYSVCIQGNWSPDCCHVDRLRLYDGRTTNQLLIDLHISTENDSAAVNNKFTEVLKQIGISNAFRTRIYETTKYVNTASYFKKMHNFSQKSATENAKKINRNSIVYDNFESILSNLSACPLVDIKRLSANQLHLAIDSKWCHVYNEMHRGRSNKPTHL